MMSSNRLVRVLGRFPQLKFVSVTSRHTWATTPFSSVRLVSTSSPKTSSGTSGSSVSSQPSGSSGSVAAVQDRRPDRLYERLQIELRAHQPDVLKSYSW